MCIYLHTRRGEDTGIAFIDATSRVVCHPRRIHSHRVFKSVARRGKTSMGWFYGFKLHLVVNDRGELLAFQITPGNVEDRRPVDELTQGLTGKLVGDRDFKKVNDTYGHDVGDEAIRMVTEVLRKRLRKSDLCSRIGGEEFLILLFNNPHEKTGDLAEELRHTVETTPFRKAQLRITISLGYVQRYADESYEALVKRSDEALYRAKHAGRNCAVFGVFEGAVDLATF